MLDSLRKKDASQRSTTPSSAPPSPYQRMQAALSPAGTQPTATAAAAPLPTPPAAPEPAGDIVVSAAAPAPTPAPQPRASTSEETGSKLIVGPDIKLKGAEITDCDTLAVEGRVEAAMESRVIQIAESGYFVGKAGVDTAEIRGHFDGELTVRKQLNIRATGCVTGKIRYGKVTIEEGGELSGDVGSLTASTSLQAERR